MVNEALLLELDARHVWHPCSQMKDFEQHPPLIVHRAKGSVLYTNRGPIIDAISSWWCKSLGHGHPEVTQAIQSQLAQFEHIIGAGTTHPNIALLAEKLAKLSGLQHAFFASDGSSAVEIAMKLALLATQKKSHPKRNQWLSLQNSYHGETIATLSVSDSLDKQPYEGLGPTCHFIQHIPYVNTPNNPLWLSCATAWPAIENALNAHKDKVCAILVEPILQGAAGMRCYSADFLNRLATWAKKNDIYLIADEIMTGLGRTGRWFAFEHAGIRPDFICLSKGLTSGTLPLSCVMIDSTIYALFYDEGFLHSHTYSGHALAVSAALATLKVMEAEATPTQANVLGEYMLSHFQDIAAHSNLITNVRSIGAVVAGDLAPSTIERIGYKIHQAALARGALLRPLGQTLYWLPPINTDFKTIDALARITQNALKAVYSNGVSLLK